LVADVSQALLALRKAGLPVNAAIARTVILGFVQEKYPQLLRSEGGQSPKVSLHTVRRFVRRELNWVVRAGTKASQKLAADWQLQCEKTFFRLVYAVANHKIHPSLIVNCDQTGVVLVPGGSQRTYEEKGAKQVSLHGKEEKRAFTCVLATAMNGTVLPTQSVHKGKTEASLPERCVFNISSERDRATEKGHRFVLNPTKHWSNQETTQKWFTDVLFPYRERMIQQHNLSPLAKCIVYFDCWAVHRSVALMTWLRQFHFIIPIFVPANCTCKLSESTLKRNGR
jgi:hypothetical protein